MRDRVGVSKLTPLTLLVLLLGSAILGITNIQQAHATPTIQFTNAIQLTNSETTATPSPFEQYITVPLGSLGVSALLRSDLGNMRFCSDSQCNAMLHAWLESCSSTCGPSASSINVWVKLPNGIGASSTMTVIFAIYDTSQTFDSSFWGEAPQLSSTYGANDNGPSVFTFYDNFHGASLDTAKWNVVTTGNGVFSVNNGLYVDSNGNSNENGVQVYTSQTFNGNYVYETYVGTYNQGTGFGCDCHLGLGFQVTPPSNAFFITINGYAFWHYGFFNVYFISSPQSNEYSSTASLPTPPFIVSAIWTQGSQILLMDYTQILTWTDTLVSYSANHFGIFSSSWRGDNSQTVNYARVRAEPPNNVMPSPTVGDLQIVSVEPVQAVFGASALVSGKPTVIKVDVKNTFPNLIITQIKTTYNGISVIDSVPIPGNCEKVFYLPDPNPINSCVTSFSTGQPIIPGGANFSLTVQIDPGNLVSEANKTNNIMSNILPVKDTVPIEVHLVPISLTSDPPNPLMSQDFNDIRTVGSKFLNGIFPVNPNETVYKVDNEYRFGNCFFNICIPLNGTLLAWAIMTNLHVQATLAEPLNENVRYVGVVEDGWFSKHGIEGIGRACPSALRTGNDVVLCLIDRGVLTEGTPVGSLTFPLRAETITHELGHTYAFDESYISANGICVQSTRPTSGYWVEQRREVPIASPQAFDFMGCGSNEFWITTDHYDRLVDCLKTPGAAVKTIFGCRGSILPDPEVFLITGVLLQNGTMLSGPLYDIPKGIPSIQPGGAGNFTVEFLGTSGNVLAHSGFDLSFNAFDSSTRADAAPFAFTTGFPNGTATIAIVSQGKVLLRIDPYSKSLRDAILSLPEKAFDKNPDQRRNALLNKVDAFDKMLGQNSINGAIQKLQNDIRPNVQRWLVDYQKDNSLELSKTEILQLIDRILAKLLAEFGSTPSNHQSQSQLLMVSLSHYFECPRFCSEMWRTLLSELRSFANELKKFFSDELQLSVSPQLRFLSKVPEFAPNLLVGNDSFEERRKT